jgi:hypothetical protein
MQLKSLIRVARSNHSSHQRCYNCNVTETDTNCDKAGHAPTRVLIKELKMSSIRIVTRVSTVEALFSLLTEGRKKDEKINIYIYLYIYIYIYVYI